VVGNAKILGKTVGFSVETSKLGPEVGISEPREALGFVVGLVVGIISSTLVPLSNSSSNNL